MFACFHIYYYKRKYQAEDNTVYSIQLKRTGDPNDARTAHPNHRSENLRLNTTNYNPILLDVGSMAMFCVILALSLLCLFCIMPISNSSGPYFVKNIIDIVMSFILHVISPCIFYLSNHDARLYVKRLFVCT